MVVIVECPVEAGDAVAGGHGGAEVVGDHHEGEIELLLKGVEELGELLLAVLVDAGGGLVEEEDLGVWR